MCKYTRIDMICRHFINLKIFEYCENVGDDPDAIPCDDTDANTDVISHSGEICKFCSKRREKVKAVRKAASVCPPVAQETFPAPADTPSSSSTSSSSSSSSLAAVTRLTTDVSSMQLTSTTAPPVPATTRSTTSTTTTSATAAGAPQKRLTPVPTTVHQPAITITPPTTASFSTRNQPAAQPAPVKTQPTAAIVKTQPAAIKTQAATVAVKSQLTAAPVKTQAAAPKTQAAAASVKTQHAPVTTQPAENKTQPTVKTQTAPTAAKNLSSAGGVKTPAKTGAVPSDDFVSSALARQEAAAKLPAAPNTTACFRPALADDDETGR
ncbi:hypothetical protein C8A05DRAFT_37507 [Staphylotrichum tortipilum]|uniref:Uncharacterized protein n=1 Tax=Staphylotrichum tortipilum TaxID=2831512 RepID=A0AAN6RQ54_9PEZI|nr:hypothetical protein C8A05DRAFT_37507 [Staphylotrichum longicolle]